MTHNFNRQGTVSRESLLVGEWTELYAVVNGVTLRVGCVKDGKLNVRRKMAVHRGLRAFGTMPDQAATVTTQMTFTGRVEELNRENLLWLLDRAPDEAKVAAQGDWPEGRINYPSPSATAQYFTIYGRRPYAATGEDLVFVMWKCRMADYIRISTIREGMRLKVVAHSDVDGDYGGSEAHPYGWVYGYDASEATPSEATPIDLDAHYWEFHSRNSPPPKDWMESQGEYGGDFDPAGDFSVAMLIEPFANVVPALNSKPKGLSGRQYQFSVQYGGFGGGTTFTGGIQFAVYKLNFVVRTIQLYTGPVGPLACGRKSLVVCSYHWDGDGTSDLRITTVDADNGLQTATRGDAFGPPQNVAVDYRIGNTPLWANSADCKFWWYGFYNGYVMSIQDAHDIWNKVKHPIDNFSPTFLNYYDQGVAVTYNADVATGPNAPYVFDVFGDLPNTPVKGP